MAPPIRTRLALAVVAAFVALVAAGVIVALNRSNGSSSPVSLSVDFAPAPGTAVDANEVRVNLVAAIERLATAPFVTIKSVGYTESRRSDIEAVVDRAARRVSSSEVISEGVDVGGPVSGASLLSENVLIGDTLWIRILQPGQDPSTPFQGVDAAGRSEQYVERVYTQLGRVFDSLPQLAQLLEQVGFEAERLGRRSTADGELDGVSATFAAADVGDFLTSAGLAFVDGHDLTGETRFELWLDTTGLRELVATGVQFHDGEALETSARIVYRVADSGGVEAPTNTVSG